MDTRLSLYGLLMQNGTATRNDATEDFSLDTLTVTLSEIIPPGVDVASLSDLKAGLGFDGMPVVGSEMTITLTMKNNSTKPFRQDFYYDVNGDGNFRPAGFLEIEGGETASISFKYTFKTEGANRFRLILYNKQAIFGSFTIMVKPKPATLTVTPVNKYPHVHRRRRQELW
jgi:hypothetical protein